MLFPCQISKGPTPRIRHCVQVDWQLELKNCIYVWFLMRQFLYSRALISPNLIIIRMQVEKCVKVNGKNKCTTYTQRWSYAIPLEMIYLTPLYNWNPHNIDYKCLHVYINISFSISWTAIQSYHFQELVFHYGAYRIQDMKYIKW